MLIYDKSEIREALSSEDVFQILSDFGGEPEYTTFGILSSTICHNEPGEGSRKLYYYFNSSLCHCYTGCAEPSFDIFELVIKVMSIQHHVVFDLNMAIRWIAQRLGIAGRYEIEQGLALEDWNYLKNYERIQEIELNTQNILLKEYNSSILNKFNYQVNLMPWLNENISQEILKYNNIGFYPGGDQITIPHYDQHGRFIGLRGRTLSEEEGQLYGKYRPLKINKIMYNHPLGFNLYGLDKAKNNIPIIQKAIVFESEKSVLKYQTYFGIESNIAVACCGSSLTAYQAQLLQEAGAQEIIIAFDKQFEELGNEECKKWIKKLTSIHNKYKNETLISFMWDKNNILQYKSSPIDEGIDKFLTLFKERVIL